MAVCLREKTFQKRQWYLEFPLKIEKILHYLSSGRKLCLMCKRKRKEHTALSFPRSHRKPLLSLFPFLCPWLMELTGELEKRRQPALPPVSCPGNHRRVRKRWELSLFVSVWPPWVEWEWNVFLV